MLVHFNIYGDIALFGYRENLTKETECKVYSSVNFRCCFQSNRNNKTFFKPEFFFFFSFWFWIFVFFHVLQFSRRPNSWVRVLLTFSFKLYNFDAFDADSFISGIVFLHMIWIFNLKSQFMSLWLCLLFASTSLCFNFSDH